RVTGTDAGNYAYSGSAPFADNKMGSAKPVGDNDAPSTANITASTTANITKLGLDVSFTGGNKVYNGDRGAEVTPGDDRVSGDMLAVHYVSATFADKKVGTAKRVTVTGITVTGSDADNYAYKNEASTAADITRRPLTVTPQGLTKVYDGTTAFPGFPPG